MRAKTTFRFEFSLFNFSRQSFTVKLIPNCMYSLDVLSAPLIFIEPIVLFALTSRSSDIFDPRIKSGVSGFRPVFAKETFRILRLSLSLSPESNGFLKNEKFCIFNGSVKFSCVYLVMSCGNLIFYRVQSHRSQKDVQILSSFCIQTCKLK